MFFALAVAFPRLRIAALILAVLVSAARIAVNDHFAGDVLGSAAIAAFVCYACARIMLPIESRAKAQMAQTAALH